MNKEIATEYKIRKFENQDSVFIIDIFNYYIQNSFAAYSEIPIGYEAINYFKEMTKGYPFYVIETNFRKLAGFSFLRPYHRIEAFKRVAEITYFILPEYTRKGLGEKLLKLVIDDARKMGIDTLLASISSLNEASIKFHEKNNFCQCGYFKSIGKKFNVDFSMIWMQKFI
jgi:phosphinothricin acetyltransferase